MLRLVTCEVFGLNIKSNDVEIVALRYGVLFYLYAFYDYCAGTTSAIADARCSELSIVLL